jgi:hypothetical protein
MEEEWRDVVGFEGLYQISNTGKIVSTERISVIIDKNGRVVNFKSPSTKMKYFIDKLGYSRLTLVDSKHKQHLVLVHRALAQAFILNPQNLPCVNHIDSNPLNYSIGNLEWCTFSYNTKHSYDTTDRIGMRGTLNGCSKYTENDALKVRELYADGMSVAEISRKLKIGYQSAYKIATNKMWKHLL